MTENCGKHTAKGQETKKIHICMLGHCAPVHLELPRHVMDSHEKNQVKDLIHAIMQNFRAVLQLVF